MTFRRDLMNIRVVVRTTSAHTTSMDVSGRRLGGAGMPPSQPGPDPRTQPVRAPLTEVPAVSTPGMVLVKTGLKRVAVRIAEVTYVEAARNYVRIHLEGGAVLKTRVPITRLASHFGTERFVRVHRGRLVNVDRVRAVNTLVGGRLSLTLYDGSKVLVARDRRRIVLAELGRSTSGTGGSR